MAGDRVIRDPIYDYVSVPGVLDGIVDHPLFQRLRRVRQTSLALAVYPSATGSRFEHALGAMHLAQVAFMSAWARSSEDARIHFQEAVLSLKLGTTTKRDDFVKQVQLATGAVALLHDVGHPPFSHALEPILERHLEAFGGPLVNEILEDRHDLQSHEVAGLLLAGYRSKVGKIVLGPLLAEVKDAGIANLAAAVLSADEGDESCLSALHSIVAGPYDVDRLDYIARDNHRIGTEFGHVDHRRLIGSFELHEVDDGRFVIAPGIRARSAVETLLTQRVQSYRWVIFHSRIVGTNAALARGLELAVELAESSEPEIRDPLDRILPNFNYLSARDEDVKRSSAQMAVPPSQGAEGGMFPPAAAEANKRLRLLAQAGVDDDSVTSFLKGAVQVAESLLVTIAVPPERQRDLRRLITYVRSALYREKRFIAVWKTNDEFVDVATDATEPLLEALRDGAAEVASSEAAVSLTAAEAEFSRGSAEGLNHVVRALASDARDVRRLERHMTDAASTVLDEGPGWWTLTYAPLRAVGRSLTLFSSDKEIDLLSRSPFVAALRNVDSAATSLFAHFFFESQTYNQWSGDHLVDARHELQQKFVEEFPKFVRAAWPLYLQTQEDPT